DEQGAPEARLARQVTQPVEGARPEHEPRPPDVIEAEDRIHAQPAPGQVSLAPGQVRKPRGCGRYCCVTFTSSTPASIRLAVLASAASKRMRIVCPANAFRLTLTGVHAPLRLTAAPSDWKTWVAVLP